MLVLRRKPRWGDMFLVREFLSVFH